MLRKITKHFNYDIILPILILVFVLGILFFMTYKPIKVRIGEQLQSVHPEELDESIKWDVNRRKAELKKERIRRKFMDRGVYD
tara:strand:+ start:101 stop:349 length:249 start_codon:yes stop_codon:yes gene_type:complete